jgi:hypothetical protein
VQLCTTEDRGGEDDSIEEVRGHHVDHRWVLHLHPAKNRRKPHGNQLVVVEDRHHRAEVLAALTLHEQRVETIWPFSK